MKNSFAVQTGLKLARTPSAREQTRRRALLALTAVLALAIASGVLGMLTTPHGPVDSTARTGPFSYFPS